MFRLLVESVQDHAIFMLDAQGRITVWNAGAERVYGYSRGEIIGQPVGIFYPAAATGAAWPEHELEVAGRTGRFEDEGWRVRKDGSRFWANVVITAMRDEAGQLIGFANVTRNLTERRRADQELREAASRLRAVVDTAVDGILTINETGILESVNPATERLFGYAADEMIGRNVSMLMPAPYRAEHDEYIGRYIRTGDARIIGIGREVRGRRKDGSDFPLELAVSETLLPDRRIFTGIVRDLTPRKQVEEALRRSEDRLAGIIGSAMDAIISVDDRQRVMLFNTAAEAIFGYSAEDILGRPLSRLIPSRFRQKHSGHIRAFGRTGVTSRSMSRPGTLLALRANGEEFPIEASISQVESGGQKFYTVILRDVIERVKAEAKLTEALDRERALREEAEAASRAKDQFIAVMSHELRTPLNGIVGYADLMEAGIYGPITAQQQHALERVRQSSNHLMSIIDHVLSFARSEKAIPQPRPELVELQQLVNETAALIEPLAHEKGISLFTRIHSLRVEIEIDARMVRQILFNLLSNAVKFTDHGSITLKARLKGGFLSLEVSDSGIGIAPEHLPLIFEPFWQADQTLTRRFGGTGLGLSVTKQIVSALHGAITVDSSPGHGSTFAVRLPVGASVGAALR